jgi:ribonuclease HI
MCLYTDGSKTVDGVGAGIYCERPGTEIQVSLGSLTTIFQAEVYAIELCAVMLLERQTASKTIRIFSDSQAALKALDSGLCVSRTVWSCRERLNDLGARNSVTLVWIPGHTGLEGNERADALAKAGAEAEFIGPEPVLGVTNSTARQAILAWTEDVKHRYWLDIGGLRHSRAMINFPLKKVFIDNLLEFDRLHLRTLVGIYTGHSGVLPHMHRIRLAENAECRLCLEDDETIEHILCQCPAAARLALKT